MALPDSITANQPVELQLFNTDVNSIRTLVYAKVRWQDTSDCHLTGTIRGPFSSHARTLPSTFQFSDLGVGETLLARAYITDPCAWSRQVPANYRVELQVHCGDKVVHELSAEFGIRDTHATGTSLKMSGKRTVLRGVGLQRAEFSAIEDWREHSAVILADEPTDSLCRNASEQGVLVFARLSGTDRLEERLHRISACPSVAVVWIDDAPIDEPLTDVGSNVLLAANIREKVNWEHADVIVWEVGDTIDDAALSIDKPLIAIRPLSEKMLLPVARAACDRLQRDLAPKYDLAGYFV